MDNLEILRSKLNARQQRFANGIIAGLTQKEAYTQAGYEATSDNSARANAAEILTNPSVSAYIQACRALAHNEAIATQEEIAMLYTQVLRTPLSRIINMHNGSINPDADPDDLECVTEYSMNEKGAFKMKLDRLSAAQKLSELLGYNKPKEVKNTIEGTVVSSTDIKLAEQVILAAVPGLEDD